MLDNGSRIDRDHEMRRWWLVLAVAFGCTSNAMQPSQPSTWQPPAAAMPMAVTAAPRSVDSVETRQYIGCNISPQTGHHVCIRQNVPCSGLATCTQAQSAFCSQDAGHEEACYEAAGECVDRVMNERELGRSRTDCYILTSTAPAFGTGVASVGAAPITLGASAPAVATPAARLLIFGGANHKTFLGCLCSEYESDSVFDEYGRFGSRYNIETIWNRYGDYGSPYANTSACNTYATDPPVVVTSDGKFIGYLTLNAYKGGAIADDDVLKWLKGKVCVD
jgi:hypothetical protein